jgi:transcriptional regulator with XRE-family HTH domain
LKQLVVLADTVASFGDYCLKSTVPTGSTDCTGIVVRLSAACGGLTFAELARITHAKPESVRRYMCGLTTPSLDFILNISVALGLSVEWVLWGRGPMLRKDFEDQVLRDAGIVRLLHAVADETRTLLQTPAFNPRSLER